MNLGSKRDETVSKILPSQTAEASLHSLTLGPEGITTLPRRLIDKSITPLSTRKDPAELIAQFNRQSLHNSECVKE